PNDTWLMTWMLMNHRKTKDNAFIEWKVTYTTDPEQAVNLYWLDVVNCHADPIFNVPGGGKPGSTYTRTAEITMPEAGHVVAAGQRIRLTATYDNQYPHTRVMGIAGMYVAPSSGPVDGCGPLPTDAATFQTPLPHRDDPPVFKVPITGLDSNGKAVTIQRPP